MNKWTLKFMVLKTNFIMNQLYITYRLKSILGISTVGFKQNYGLILIRLLKKYKLPIYSMSISRVEEDLSHSDLNAIHDSGIRLNKTDYLTIIINTELKQSFLVVGNNLLQYLPKIEQTAIESTMQSKMRENRIIEAMEIGMSQINSTISNNLNDNI